jgi:hypothetical protein
LKGELLGKDGSLWRKWAHEKDGALGEEVIEKGWVQKEIMIRRWS